MDALIFFKDETVSARELWIRQLVYNFFLCRQLALCCLSKSLVRLIKLTVKMFIPLYGSFFIVLSLLKAVEFGSSILIFPRNSILQVSKEILLFI